MKNFADRVTECLKNLGIKPANLSKKTGLSRAIISKIVNNKSTNIEADTLFKLADALECDPRWLYTGKHPTIKYSLPIQGHYPLLSWELAANFNSLNKEDLIGAILVPTNVACSSKTFVVRMKNESMLPPFPEGALVFIDPEERPYHNDYVVAKLEGETSAILRQLKIDGSKKYLSPSNRDWPERMKLFSDKDEIIGVAINACLDIVRSK